MKTRIVKIETELVSGEIKTTYKVQKKKRFLWMFSYWEYAPWYDNLGGKFHSRGDFEVEEYEIAEVFQNLSERFPEKIKGYSVDVFVDSARYVYYYLRKDAKFFNFGSTHIIHPQKVFYRIEDVEMYIEGLPKKVKISKV